MVLRHHFIVDQHALSDFFCILHHTGKSDLHIIERDMGNLAKPGVDPGPVHKLVDDISGIQGYAVCRNGNKDLQYHIGCLLRIQTANRCQMIKGIHICRIIRIIFSCPDAYGICHFPKHQFLLKRNAGITAELFLQGCFQFLFKHFVGHLLFLHICDITGVCSDCRGKAVPHTAEPAEDAFGRQGKLLPDLAEGKAVCF